MKELLWCVCVLHMYASERKRREKCRQIEREREGGLRKQANTQTERWRPPCRSRVHVVCTVATRCCTLPHPFPLSWLAGSEGPRGSQAECVESTNLPTTINSLANIAKSFEGKGLFEVSFWYISECPRVNISTAVTMLLCMFPFMPLLSLSLSYVLSTCA